MMWETTRKITPNTTHTQNSSEYAMLCLTQTKSYPPTCHPRTIPLAPWSCKLENWQVKNGKCNQIVSQPAINHPCCPVKAVMACVLSFLKDQAPQNTSHLHLPPNNQILFLLYHQEWHSISSPCCHPAAQNSHQRLHSQWHWVAFSVHWWQSDPIPAKHWYNYNHEIWMLDQHSIHELHSWTTWCHH